MQLSRRALCLASLAGVLAPVRDALAKVPALPTLPLSIAVAELDGKRVADDTFVKRQVARAVELLAPHGISVKQARLRSLPPSAAKLETAEERDALAAFVQPSVINVFIVASLRDIHDPERMRMGVRWRMRRNVKKDYVIITSNAMMTTLCHELGHFFGNGHSKVVNNVMSYVRLVPSKVAFDAAQGARMRQVARKLLSQKRVLEFDALASAASSASNSSAAQ